MKKDEIDNGERAGVPTDMAAKLKVLERENRELRLANEILRKGERLFCLGGARRPVQTMIAFIDDHRGHELSRSARCCPVGLGPLA